MIVIAYWSSLSEVQLNYCEMSILVPSYSLYVPFYDMYFSFFTNFSRLPGSNFGYDMGWWKEEHFNASDMDGDGLLNLTEFNDFLHLADTKNPKLLEWLCQEEIRYFGFWQLL
ncbi:hypothetical protein Dimus_029222 [Dionaea muscipula]